MTILQLTHWLSIDATNSTLHTNDDLGWKALELSWLTIQGNRLWVDAFDWLALFLMMQFIYFSVKSNNERISIFPRVWSTLGVAIGCLALVDFIACCARFSTHWQEFSALAGVVSFINTVILLPGWLAWFGALLPLAKRSTFTALVNNDFQRHREQPTMGGSVEGARNIVLTAGSAGGGLDTASLREGDVGSNDDGRRRSVGQGHFEIGSSGGSVAAEASRMSNRRSGDALGMADIELSTSAPEKM